MRINCLSFAGLCVGLMMMSAGMFSQPAEKWTVDAVLKQEAIEDLAISPEGRRVVWVKSYPDSAKDKFLKDIYLTFLPDSKAPKTSSPETIRLTRSGDNTAPKWNRSGERIAFLSSRKVPESKTEATQIWLLDARGGEAQPLTKLENGVEAHAWLNDSTLVFSAREEKTRYEKAQKSAKDDAVAVEDTTEYWPVRLFVIALKSKKIRRLSQNPRQIGEFSPSPDGRYIVYSENQSPTYSVDNRRQPLQYLIDLTTGQTREIFALKYLDPAGFSWTADSKGFYANDGFSNDPHIEGAGIRELYYFDIATMAYQKVPLDWEWAFDDGSYAVTANGVHVQLAAGPRFQPRFYRRSGAGWKWGDVADERLRHSTSFTIGPDGETVVFDYSRPSLPPKYFYGRYRDGNIEVRGELVELNTYLSKLPLPRSEVVEWAGYNGETVNGILYYPQNYRPGRKYPLMTVIHGGPSGVDLDAWYLTWTRYHFLWTQKGAFVLRPNYHGSSNHGLDFVESIKGHYYEKEVPDILNGIHHLIAQELVDPDSLGVMGWSNGAILAIALTTDYPEMFKAVAPGAGDVNWTSDYGNCEFGVSFDESYLGGPPWKMLEEYIEKSPLFRFEQVVTPTLISFGSEDRAVPTEQGWQHFRALQQIGKAPVRFLLYPGEPHSFRRISHQKRKMEEEIAWFDYYLFGKKTYTETLAARVLPESAPLALLARRQQIRQSNGQYGEMVNGILAPETVTLGDTLQVGRFEVTRAQWQAFRPQASYPAGRDNYPAAAISFEDARAYTTWLSEKTGQRYRLPSTGELKMLQKLAGKQENNLAYWAGYDPTPDERQALAAQIAKHDPDLLLMPAGSCPPGNSAEKDTPLLYDLDGNVAEWSVNKTGSGEPSGASAATVRDKRTGLTGQPPQGFVGLRVVRE